MVEFKPIELGDGPRIREWLRRYPPQVSEHTFVNLYVWRYRGPIRWAEVAGGLVFVEVDEGTRHVLGPPVGDVELPALLTELREAGIAFFDRIPKPTAEALRSAGLRVQPDRDNADYVYLRQDLAELAGRPYHRQKNLVNRCLASYKCEYSPINEESAEEVLKLLNRWFAEKDTVQARGLAEEYWAIRETLDRFPEFELCGGAIRIKGRMEAFSIGGALSANTAVVHFEKAITEYTGLYQLMNQWFCEYCLAGFEYVNREQDLGVPGLRKAKRSYHPHHMVEKFVARWE